MGVPLIGCGCHKMNLAVKAYLARRPAVEKAVERVDKVVSQLRNLKAAGALRELTSLTPIKRNVTRWSSTYQILHRFLRFDVQARQLDDVDTIRRADAERIKSIMASLKNFKSIMTRADTLAQFTRPSR
jgi:cell division FtsZ-interacting protein ZapD